MKKLKLLFAFIAIFAISCSDDDNYTAPIDRYDVKVISHRGYFKETAENSIEALNKAHEIGSYGSEFDVVVTLDGIPVINHDDNINGIDIKKNNYDVIKDFTLSNGERLPTLDEYLAAGKLNKRMQLILEIKDHYDDALNDRAVDLTLDLVKKHGLEKQVEYISFSTRVCQRLVEKSPNSEIMTLGELIDGNYTPMPPKMLKELGFTGMSYHYSVFYYDLAKEWVKEAKELGIKVAAWTVNEPEDMHKLIEAGVEIITTDEPLMLQQILKEKVKP